MSCKYHKTRYRLVIKHPSHRSMTTYHIREAAEKAAAFMQANDDTVTSVEVQEEQYEPKDRLIVVVGSEAYGVFFRLRTAERFAKRKGGRVVRLLYTRG